MKVENWIVCQTCDAEYKVVSSISNELNESYCPFCGSEVQQEESDLEEYEE